MQFETAGVQFFERCANSSAIEQLRSLFGKVEHRGGSRMFNTLTCREALFGNFADVLAAVGSSHARPVRVLAFDKSPTSNWGLGWHQDRVVALKQKIQVPGFVNWTLKSGVHHVQAPVEILRSMFSLRLHLDDCPAENGALRVVPTSFRFGHIEERQIPALVVEHGEVVCEARSGDILAMKALTLHASSPSVKPSHRRVLHVDFCTCELPKPLDWAFV